jgi:hypothetical protein
MARLYETVSAILRLGQLAGASALDEVLQEFGTDNVEQLLCSSIVVLT